MTPNKPVLRLPQAPTSSVFIKIQKKKVEVVVFDGKLESCRLREEATSHMELGVLQDYGSGMDWPSRLAHASADETQASCQCLE
jgi:hypothetical protein